MSSPQAAAGRPRLVAAAGDANDPRTYSGIPFFFLEAGKKAGLLDAGIDLTVDRPAIKARRIAWNLHRLLLGRGVGGFQYSESFLEAMWRGRHPQPGSVVVNCYQLYPPSLVGDARLDRWFFIDQTLTQLFSYYEQHKVVGRGVAAGAIEREAEGYRSATGIIVYSHWAKASLVDDYGVGPEKVQVVLLGPSIDPGKLSRHEDRPRVPKPGEPLELIFVGKDWYVKGLDRILRAIGRARRGGADVRLSVIGCARADIPEELRDIEGVRWLGFIDKRDEEERFIELLSDAHAGCLLSRYEAGGIALREYLALGLPVIGPDTGGATEHLVPEASIGVPPEMGDEEVSEIFASLAQEPARLEGMNQAAWDRRTSVLWSESMATFARFWPYPGN